MPEFKLPQLGENIDSGDIVSVLVNVGDVVKPQQGVIEIETDKAVIEVPCTEAGRVTKIHVKPGETVAVGATVLTLDAVAGGATAPASKPAPAKPEPPKPAPTSKPAPAAAPAKAEVAKSEPAPAVGNGHRSAASAVVAAPKADAASHTVEPAGPAVRRLARELGIDLSRVSGTGPGGRIIREDVIAAVRHANATAPLQIGGRAASTATESDSWGGIRREPLPKIRKTIAANMVRSATTIPHVTNFDDADVTELERIRKASTADYAKENVKLTTLSFVMKAVALSLRQHPTINASLDLENNQIIYKEYVNLGVAIDTARGLVVPVIRNVDRMSIPHIALGITDIVAKAKNTSLSIDEMRGGTFTISNLGAVGGTYSTPIINHPEVAILLLGRTRKMPVVVDDKIEVRQMMPLSISYDHRLVDGATAARFLTEVIGYLQTPSRLLLAP